MTIKVTIENSDPRASAVIEVQVYSRSVQADESHLVNPTGETYYLRALEKREFYVHSSQDLHVREVSQ